MHRLRSLPVWLLAAAWLPALSPAARAQGPFALQNIGVGIESIDARMTGRGGWGMAETDTLLVGSKNLASLAYLGGVTFLVDGVAESRASRGGGLERSTRKVMAPNLRAALPLWDFGAVGFGFQLRRSTSFSSIKPMAWTVEDSLVDGREVFVREGDQFEIPLSLSLRPVPQAAVAVGLNLVRGSLKEVLIDEYYSFDGGVTPGASSRILEDHFSGTGVVWAALVRPVPAVGLGFSYSPAYDLDVEREMSVDGVVARAFSERVYRLPPEWRAGGELQLPGRWRCGLDYEVRAFSEFSGNDEWAATMQDEWLLGFGLERQRASRRRGGVDNLPLRLGASIRRWGYTVGGDTVTERTISLGTGFTETDGSLDLALSYGWLGSENQNGYRDRYLRLTVSFFDREAWW